MDMPELTKELCTALRGKCGGKCEGGKNVPAQESEGPDIELVAGNFGFEFETIVHKSVKMEED